MVAGFAKVEAALVQGDAAALLHASDAAPDGVRKLDGTLRRNTDGDRTIAVLNAFTSAQLDLALGRANVVHAALLAGPESKAFLTRARRLERFRTGTVAIERLKSPRNGNGMAESTEKTGDKKLSIATTKTLTLKPRGSDTGVGRQSLSHGRTKSFVIEKVRSRSATGKPAKAEPAPAPAPAPAKRAAPGKAAAPLRLPRPLRPRRPRRRPSPPASCCTR